MPDEICERYTLYPDGHSKARAPQPSGVQSLENRVAKFLRRPAHKVAVRNTALLGTGDLYQALNVEIDTPREKANLRAIDSTHLELGYEYDWPTYDRLGKSEPSRVRDQTRLSHLYAWQWCILWDRDILPPDQWSREVLGIPSDVPVEEFLPMYVRHLAIERHGISVFTLAERLGELPEFCGTS